MLYDLSTDVGRSRFERKVKISLEKGALVEFVEKKPIASPPQKNYLHLILGYFALETGYSLDYVKRNYFKATCSPDIFVTEVNDGILGKKVKVLRSVNECTVEEMTTAIERFRNWSSEQAGIYLPEPHEDRFLNEIRFELNKNVWI